MPATTTKNPANTVSITLTDAAADPSIAAAASGQAVERGLVRRSHLRDLVERRPHLASVLGRLVS